MTAAASGARTAPPSSCRRQTAKRKRRPHYSKREDQILARLFPKDGAEACQAKLRRRSLPSIKQRAAILGLKPPCDQRHQGLRRTLCDVQAGQALDMRDQGMAFAKIGSHFGVCEATATNAVLHAQCLRAGGTPARRDASGAILARDIERLRAMLRSGERGCAIARALGISANSVSYHRRKYQAELDQSGAAYRLPPPGAGTPYSGRKLTNKEREAVVALLKSGLGAMRVARQTGVSKTHIGRIRRTLIKEMALQGKTLAGCTSDGSRLVTLKSTRFVTAEQTARLRQLLIERIPVRRAALLTGIGGCTAYRLRDDLRVELAAKGETLPNPILPGRVRVLSGNTLPGHDIYRFRALLETTSFDEARQQLSKAHPPAHSNETVATTITPTSPPKRLTFAEQLERVARGGKLISVQPFHRQVAAITYGGVCSYGD